MRKSKRAPAGLAVILAAMWLWGCGAGNYQAGREFEQESLLAVDKDGSVVTVLAESFDAPYYQQQELESMINSEIAAFNQGKGGESVRVEKVWTENSMINVVMKFVDMKVYEEYTGTTFFVGTVEEAMESGFDWKLPLYNISDETQLAQDELSGLSKFHILIVDEPDSAALSISTFGKILYASEGVVPGRNKNFARIATPVTGLSYIIFD